MKRRKSFLKDLKRSSLLSHSLMLWSLPIKIKAQQLKNSISNVQFLKAILKPLGLEHNQEYLEFHIDIVNSNFVDALIVLDYVHNDLFSVQYHNDANSFNVGCLICNPIYYFPKKFPHKVS